MSFVSFRVRKNDLIRLESVNSYVSEFRVRKNVTGEFRVRKNVTVVSEREREKREKEKGGFRGEYSLRT